MSIESIVLELEKSLRVIRYDWISEGELEILKSIYGINHSSGSGYCVFYKIKPTRTYDIGEYGDINRFASKTRLQKP